MRERVFFRFLSPFPIPSPSPLPLEFATENREANKDHKLLVPAPKLDTERARAMVSCSSARSVTEETMQATKYERCAFVEPICTGTGKYSRYSTVKRGETTGIL